MQNRLHSMCAPSVPACATDDADLASAVHEVGRLWASLAAIEPRNHESDETPALTHFRELIDRVLSETAEFASELMLHCERRAEDLSGARAQTLSSLSDTCFMAASETNSKRAELDRAYRHGSPLRTLSACGSALRRARKVLIGVDAELARLLDVRPSIDGTAHLAESLEIRKQYSLLRRTAEADGTPAPDELPRRLRAVELRIGLLCGRDVHDKLRVDDRVELHVLRERLIKWLEGCVDANGSARERDHDLTEGTRLWQDVVGFTHLLYQVNLRQELREHDAAIVHSALLRFERDGDSAMDDALWTSLMPLLGLLDPLDDLLRRNERCPSQCLGLLRVLNESLRSGGGTPSRASH